MRYLRACRACLSTDGKLEKVNERIRRIFSNATDLQIEPDDGLPQYFCAECYSYIKKTMAFRRRSRRAHFVLKEIVLVKGEVCQDDILTVDRRKTNLISPLSYWNPEKNGAFYYSTSDAKTEEEEEEESKDSNIVEDSAKENIENQAGIEIKIEKENVTTHLDTVTSSQPLVLNYTIGQSPLNQAVKTYHRKSYNIKELKPSIAPSLQNEDIMLLAQPTNVKKKKVYGEFVKEDSNVLSNSMIVVDIKPDNWREIEREEAEKRQREIEQALKEIKGEDSFDQNDNHFDDSNFNDEAHEGIDMEDIFKGLKEEPVDSDFEWPDPTNNYEPPPPVDKEMYTEKMKKYKKGAKKHSISYEPVPAVMRNKMVKALSVCEVKYISINKQKEIHKNKFLQEPFKSATIKCMMCFKIFPNIKAIQDHVKIHNVKATFPHICPVCSERFKTQDLLQQHCSHHHWYSYRCGTCTDTHYSLYELIACYDACEEPQDSVMVLQSKNLRKLFKIRPLKQEDMGLSLKHWTDMLGQLVGQPKGKYNCDKCKLILGAKKLWKEHMEKHEQRGPGRLECDICGFTYAGGKMAHFITHLLTRHMFMYKCKKCHVKLYNRNQALCHYGRCPKFKVKPVEKRASTERIYCSMCFFNTNEGMTKLYEHQLTTHGYIRLPMEVALHHPKLRCGECKTFFCSYKYLNVHFAKEGHGEIVGKDLMCLNCGQILDSKESLEEHRRLVHTREKLQTHEKHNTCTWCQKEFKDRFSVNLHMREVHQEDDNLRLCEMCGKIINRCNFVSHKVRHKHEPEQQYQCRFCHYKCINVVPYVIHILFNHTLKPYCCTVCGVRFHGRCDVRDHILKTHAPCRPYECGECNRQFAHLDYLQDHFKKIHQVDIKKTNKSVFLKPQPTRKVFVYEHMKIDGSLVGEEVLAKTLVEKCDYMEEVFVPIDYKEAFFFDPTVNFNVPTRLDSPYKTKEKLEEEDHEEDDENQNQAPKKKIKKEPTSTNTTLQHDEISQRTSAREISKPKTSNKKLSSKKRKDLIQEIKTEPPVKTIKYDYFGNIIDESQESNATNEWKVDTDSQNFVTAADIDYKTEQRLDMPDLDNEEIIPVFDEEQISGSTMQMVEEIEESVVSQEMEEEKEEPMIEEKEEPTPEELVEEMMEEQEEAELIVPDDLMGEKEEPLSEDFKEEQTVMEDTVLTEDITGELVIHEGQHYILIEGLLYKIETT